MRKPIAVSDLLNQGQAKLQRLKAGAQAASHALAAVQSALPPELGAHIHAAGVSDGRLTVIVDSGSWATRVRYAAETLAATVGRALTAKISEVRVQVRPRPR